MAFLATLLAITLMVKFKLIEHVSYALERGRLKAIRESLPAQDKVDDLNWASQAVALSIIPTVVSIEVVLANQPMEELLRDHPNTTEQAPLTKSDSNTTSSATSDSRGDRRSRRNPNPEQPLGMGSGFIVDAENGHILTNAHVVAGAKEVRIELSDGRSARGKVLGLDPSTDLAVVQINLKNLHALPLTLGTEAHLGEAVFAVGNPFGLEGSVTKGIISAVQRHHVRINGLLYDTLLQTDAVITPGSSGGPLVNLRGEVVGINTAMATHRGEYEGVGFAIPVERIREMLAPLVDGGPGFLGVWISPMNEGDQRLLDIDRDFPVERGVYIQKIIPHTGAEKAGFQAGDILIALDHELINTVQSLGEWLAESTPGQVVDAQLLRNEKLIHLPVEISRRFAPR